MVHFLFVHFLCRRPVDKQNNRAYYLIYPSILILFSYHVASRVALVLLLFHVHLLVKAPPTRAPQHIANQLNGYTARVLRDAFPQLPSRLPSLWSRSYSVGSTGAVSTDTIQRYIEQQKASSMHLTIQLKLQPTPEQAALLRQTLESANAACNAISETAWNTREFKQFGMHKLTYYDTKLLGCWQSVRSARAKPPPLGGRLFILIHSC